MSIMDTLAGGLKSNLTGDVLAKGLEFAGSAEKLNALLDNEFIQQAASKLNIPVDTLKQKVPELLPLLASQFMVDGKLDLTKLSKEALLSSVTGLLKN